MSELINRMRAIDQRQAQIERDMKHLNGGQFTGAAGDEYERLNREFADLKRRHDSMTTATSTRRTQPSSSAAHFGGGDEQLFEPSRPNKQRWLNLATGEEVRCWGPREKIADPESQASIGRFVRAVITGNWRGAEVEKEIYNLSGNDSGGGHYLIPEELSSQWLDLARAKSVMTMAGMSTVNMSTEVMRIARLASDPTFATYSENEEIAASDVTFDAVQLVVRKVATYIKMSREIAEDSPNASQAVEDVLGRALGVEIDRQMLIGNAGDELTGLVVTPGVGSTGSVGGILWQDFHGAVVGVRAANYEPNAIVAHPTIWGDAQIITSGDGTNSAALWQGPPPSLDGIAQLQTTAIGTGYAVAGEFRHTLMGVRGGISLETSTVAGDAFQKHQVWVKAVIRLAFVTTQPTAFHVLSGITT